MNNINNKFKIINDVKNNNSLLIIILIFLTFYSCIPNLDKTPLDQNNALSLFRLQNEAKENADNTSASTTSKPWTRLLGVAGSPSRATSITTVANGNIYATGNTDGNLDGQILTGSNDIFIVKYDSNGNKQWTRLLGAATGSTFSISITADASENIYVSGYTNRSLDGQILTGTFDMFVTKYDSIGIRQWTRLLGVGLGTTFGSGINSDALGNIYIVGYTNGNLDGQIITGSDDLFIVKYDSNGNRLWTRLFGEAGARSYGYSITIDSSTNIYITGYSNGNLDGQIRIGNYDSFIIKYDLNGNRLWTRLFGSASGNTFSNNISLDNSGNIYITGRTNGNMYGEIKTGISDLFLIKCDSNGNRLNTKLLGVVAGTTNSLGIVLDNIGNVFVTGDTNGNLDGKTITGSIDLFVVKYDSSGVKQWTDLRGVLGANTKSKAAAFDTNGNLYITGDTNGNLDSQTLTGTIDLFIIRY